MSFEISASASTPDFPLSANDGGLISSTSSRTAQVLASPAGSIGADASLIGETSVASSSFKGPLIIGLLETQHLNRSHLSHGLARQVQVCSDLSVALDYFGGGTGGCLLVDFDHDRDALVSSLQEAFDAWNLLSVVACSRFDSGALAMEAARAGCVEFASLDDEAKSTTSETSSSRVGPSQGVTTHLYKAIQRACQHDIDGNDSPRNFRADWATLTGREKESLRHFVSGMNTKVIAKQLSISYQTVDKHRNRALRKMNCGSLVDFASRLYRQRCIR